MSTISPYLGDGSTTQFDITFDYEDADSVHVRVNGTDVTFTFVSASRVQLSTAPATGVGVEVYRKTDVSEPAVDFEDGAIIQADNLDLAVGQVRRRTEELESESLASDERALRAPSGEIIGDLPARADRAGRYAAFDASGEPVASTGTGTDAGLRADLALATGARLISTTGGTLQNVLDTISYAKKADLFVVFGQSLTVGRGPQMTSANAIVASLYTFNGGSEAATAVNASADPAQVPIPTTNYASMVPFFSPAGVEPWGPGLGYQSAKAGIPRSFVWVPGLGGTSVKGLHGAQMQNLRQGLNRAVKLIRNAGYEPTIHFIINHGHADADALDDGGLSGTPTSTANYTLGWRKSIATMRTAADEALGYDFTGPIWVVPLLTQNLVATLAARRDIVVAQSQMPTAIPGVKLMPSYSQFANSFETDLGHPGGSAYRLYAELAAAYIRAGLTPPRIVSKAVVSGKVQVTFDQAIKYASVADATSPGNSKDGFTVIDNTGAEVAITATSISGSVVTLTVASTANLTGNWYVRNGLQLLGTIGVGASPVSYMPRTRVAGLVDVGTAQDGTVLQNTAIPEEFGP